MKHIVLKSNPTQTNKTLKLKHLLFVFTYSKKLT